MSSINEMQNRDVATRPAKDYAESSVSCTTSVAKQIIRKAFSFDKCMEH